MVEVLIEKVPIEVSNRHVHLSKEHCKVLFGYNELKPSRNLSQPSQYLAQEKVNIVSLNDESKVIENVSIIGPTRENSQVEIMKSDANSLGLSEIYVRESGNINNTPGIKLRTNLGEVVFLDKGLIIAKRHLHIPEFLAQERKIKNGEVLDLEIENERKLKGLVARISPMFSLSVHIDVDEAIELEIPRFNPRNQVKSKIEIGGKEYSITLRPSAYGRLVRN